MSTIFIAVQCFQCSTMQVKQQRRSGNKWICAVCNEKQSVQKVFARAPMAKDVRKFVQSFNMSRKYADEQTKVDEILDEEIVDEDQLDFNAKRKRRSDWSEYLDLEEDRSQTGRENERELGSDFTDGKIVTELPEEKTRKHCSTSCSSRPEGGEGKRFYRPVFPKRTHIAKNSAIQASKWRKGVREDDEKVSLKANLSSKDEIRNWESQSDIEASKWSKGMSKDDENACILAKVGGPSPKWSEYMTEEDKNMGTEQDMDTLKMIINDEIVEDDIHPDFK
ncbi:MRN complex-interacting protein isoform X3 [Cucurbita pepo subsp. pepo]|uniref:MRN complex-interacting protein isoform X2 n=1 Tax=Cucurbita pepo subsp. pepo TaxID=3664 RepID=UPI000C9D3033|nr:MRN complex-interacting protein isoform X2 [Cucurbita pepo subsp. pepo]XP_023549687.1 MRN complex-interacting protein isoform X3 [Cucurbita pepo subsp. pepo]